MPTAACAGEATAGPASLTLGVEQAWASIIEAMDRAGVDRHRTGGAVAVAAALAGSRNRENRARFHALNPLGVPVIVMTDGHASLIGALAGRPGTVAAVGTGVAVHRLQPDGRVASCSGWGFPAGDEGSGAWIGQRAIAWYLRHLDGRDGRESLLGPVLAGRVGSQAGEIQAWLLGAPSTRYASLAPLVVDAAAEGDAVAGGILDAAAAEISCAIDALGPAGTRRAGGADRRAGAGAGGAAAAGPAPPAGSAGRRGSRRPDPDPYAASALPWGGPRPDGDLAAVSPSRPTCTQRPLRNTDTKESPAMTMLDEVRSMPEVCPRRPGTRGTRPWRRRARRIREADPTVLVTVARGQFSDNAAEVNRAQLRPAAGVDAASACRRRW